MYNFVIFSIDGDRKLYIYKTTSLIIILLNYLLIFVVSAVAYQDLFKISWQPLLRSYVTKTCVADSKPPRACYSAMFWSVCTCRASVLHVSLQWGESRIFMVRSWLALTVKTNRSNLNIERRTWGCLLSSRVVTFICISRGTEGVAEAEGSRGSRPLAHNAVIWLAVLGDVRTEFDGREGMRFYRARGGSVMHATKFDLLPFNVKRGEVGNQIRT